MLWNFILKDASWEHKHCNWFHYENAYQKLPNNNNKDIPQWTCLLYPQQPWLSNKQKLPCVSLNRNMQAKHVEFITLLTQNSMACSLQTSQSCCGVIWELTSLWHALLLLPRLIWKKNSYEPHTDYICGATHKLVSEVCTT